MPKAVLLSGEIGDDELRVWWDETAEGDGLHVYGPSRLRRWFMSILDGPRLALKPGFGFAERHRLEEELLTRQPSPLAELEEAGYDPATIVLSIRKKGAPAPEAGSPDDVRKKLLEALDAMSALDAAVAAAEESKGCVYVLSEEEKDAVLAASGDAKGAVEAALALALRQAETPDVALPTAPKPDRVIGPASRGRDDFIQAVILSWERQGDEDEVYFHLMDKGRMVGEVYETDNGFRWHCKTSDRRSTEDALQDAKDNLVLSYCARYANDARDVLLARFRAAES